MKDGGPAFPQVNETSGMTLREWYAGQALPALIPHFLQGQDAADESYRIADKMIARRNAPRPRMNLDEVALELARELNDTPPESAFLGGRAQRVSRIQIKIAKVLEQVVRHG